MNRKLLICDDDVDIVEMLEIVLDDSELEVITEVDSKKVLQVIADIRPDLVLMDLWMPVVTGDEVLRHMREDKKLTAIPVLIMSAAQDGRKIAMEAGANGYISKPFDVSNLIQKVNELISSN